jgi:hypothetical protein
MILGFCWANTEERKNNWNKIRSLVYIRWLLIKKKPLDQISYLGLQVEESPNANFRMPSQTTA